MGTVMVVANQTLGADALRATVRDRIDGGARDFHVVVPATHTTHEAAAWLGGFEGMSHKTMLEVLERDAVRLGEVLAARAAPGPRKGQSYGQVSA